MKMVYPEKSAEAPQCNCINTCVSIDTYKTDYEYLSKRIRDQDKKIRLLVRILVDKKVIGPELAKTFEETASSSKDILAWYLDLEKKNSKKE